MPLRDITAFHDWVRDERPAHQQWAEVRFWIADLSIRPWQYPSIPVPEESDQPDFEVRTALVAGVRITYQVEYITDAVDLLEIRTVP